MTGLDTGFFLRVFDQQEQAGRVWDKVLSGDEHGAISTLTLFELARHGLRGRLDHEKTQAFVDDLPALCSVAWADDLMLMKRSARISHGSGIATVDAIILAASLIRLNVSRIYTTDADFEKYEGGPEIILL